MRSIAVQTQIENHDNKGKKDGFMNQSYDFYDNLEKTLKVLD